MHQTKCPGWTDNNNKSACDELDCKKLPPELKCHSPYI